MDPTGQENATHEVNVSVIDAQATGSTADKTGFAVQVVYTNAPSILLYSETFPSKETADKVFQDLCMLAAAVEGLIKQENFEEAQAKTADFLAKAKANSGSTPTQLAQNAPND